MRANFQMAIKKYIPSILAGIICIAIVVGIFVFPKGKNSTSQLNLSEYSSVYSICELATLKSFYHNVVMFEEEPNGGSKFANDVLLWPFGEYTKIGYKQLWMEYSGIVETGVDASQIQISEPNAQGIVEAYMPDAKVLNVDADEYSFTEPLTESGWFTKITSKEQAEAYAAAQSKMTQEAENDQALLMRAKRNAKILLEQYIINTGKEMGVNLSVKWVDNQ